MADAPAKTEEQVQAQAPASAPASAAPPAQASAPVAPPTKPAAAPAPPAEVASDPEEDDLSDLDDVLDEFANTKLDSKLKSPLAATAAPKSSGPGRPEDKDPTDLLLEDENAFAQQLQKEMEQLLGQGDFGKQFEDIMKEMSKEMGGADPLAALAGDAPAASKSAPKAKEAGSSTQADTATKAEKSFQETIKKTMERMQSSGDAAGAAAASASQDDILAQMLASMESGGFGGEGSDEDFSKILMGMMEQLTNRDILYEPMKELNDKFPKWMEDHEGKVDEADMKRYKEQQVLVKEITERFERKGYSDDDAGDREYIVERMQKMQAAGSPPPDLVGDMNAAQEALQEMDQGCPTQ